MNIRHAVPGDARAVRWLANALRVNYANPQRDGFLVHILSEKGYLGRIESSPFFYVGEEDDRIQGFMMCYDDATMQILAQNNMLDHEERLAQTELKDKDKFTFSSQIGTTKRHRQSRTAMMNRLFADMKQRDINTTYVCVVHEPIRNEASLTFIGSLGFELYKTARDYDGMLWGIYRKDL